MIFLNEIIFKWAYGGLSASPYRQGILPAQGCDFSKVKWVIGLPFIDMLEWFVTLTEKMLADSLEGV